MKQTRSLLFGMRFSVVQGLYPKGYYEPGDRIDDPNGPMMRLGPALGYSFHSRPGSRFDQPMLILLSQWHLTHRWRTGVDSEGRGTHSAIPTLILGFTFKGELAGRNGAS